MEAAVSLSWPFYLHPQLPPFLASFLKRVTVNPEDDSSTELPGKLLVFNSHRQVGVNAPSVIPLTSIVFVF